MPNPFDNEAGTFHLIASSLGEYSLWPTFKDVPTGWYVVLEGRSRQECVDYLERHWVHLSTLKK